MSKTEINKKFPALRFDRSWTLARFDGAGDLDRQVTFDEILLNKVSSSAIGPSLYINSFPRCLVATVRESRMRNFEEARRALSDQGWPVVVRCTGGSCVPQGPGVINFSVIHPKIKGWHLEDGYKLLCEVMAKLLESYGLNAITGEVPGSFCDGRYNLQVGGQKLVGTAQRWAGGSRENAAVLSHACLLVDIDLAESTEKINTLYSLCGNPQQFSAQACTTLRDCLGETGKLSTEDLVTDVEQRLVTLSKKYFKIPS